jgi:hypothetical protein
VKDFLQGGLSFERISREFSKGGHHLKAGLQSSETPP